MSQPEPMESFVDHVARDTWNLFKVDPLLFVLAAVVVMLLSAVSFGVLAGPLTVGYLELVRRKQRGEGASVGDVFSGFDKFLPSLLVVLLVAVFAFVGTLCLVVPGVLVTLFTAFSLHVVGFEGASASAALKRSYELVRDNFLNTIILLLALCVLQAVGGALLLGFVLSAPLSLIATVVAYGRLVQPQSLPPLVTPQPL